MACVQLHAWVGRGVSQHFFRLRGCRAVPVRGLYHTHWQALTSCDNSPLPPSPLHHHHRGREGWQVCSTCGEPPLSSTDSVSTLLRQSTQHTDHHLWRTQTHDTISLSSLRCARLQKRTQIPFVVLANPLLAHTPALYANLGHPFCQNSSLHSSAWSWNPDKKKTKPTIEKAVDTLKEKKKKAVIEVTEPKEEVEKPQLSLARKAWDVVLHYYHGFRVLALDIRVAFRLFRLTLVGKQLTRREHKQFRRTVGDIFRVVPFSVFVIIPFMEFLLPVYLWLFPNALPSTFQSSSSKEARKKKELKVKLQMAKFLQGTIEEMAVSGRDPNKKETVQDFAEFFEKIRTTGAEACNEDIIKFSKLFEDELTLDNLSRPQLVALCKFLSLQPIGSSNFLRFQLRMKLRQLKADDKMIQKEGVDSLTVAELQSASRARGMRALGIPVKRLKSQLVQWLDLHLNQEIPTSLLLLSRALYLPESVPPTDALQATLSTLPETIVEEAEVRVADTVGEAVDNKTRLDVILQQEELIKEEAQEKEREKVEMEATAAAKAARLVTETLQDSAPIVSMATEEAAAAEGESENISPEELRDLSQAVSSLKGELSLEEERASLEELKEEREEYCEDVADLAEECEEQELTESKGSALLGKRVESMISKIDHTLQILDSGFVTSSDTLQKMQEERSDMITTQQLEEALTVLRGTSCDAKTRSLIAVLDEDHDGNIKLEELAEVIETLAREDTDIKPEHVAQISELIKKELTLQEQESQQQAAAQ